MEDDDEASIDDNTSEPECAAEVDISAAETFTEEGAEAQAAEENDDPTKPWQGNPKYKTRNNSPTRLPSKSTVWDSIKRLNEDHPKVKEGYTHACTQVGCGRFFKLVKLKDIASWPTTRAGEHLRNSHPEDGGKDGVARSAAIKVTTVILYYLFDLHFILLI